MYVALMVFGALVAVLGVVAIGFGIPINEFSLGNTLIMSGTTALTGGLILIALAAALRQLTRIAEALTRPMPRPQRPAEPVEGPGARPAPPRVPFPPKPPSREPASLEPRPPEPPRPVAATEERPRPRIPPVPVGGGPGELDEPVPPPIAAPFPPPSAAPVAPAAPSHEPARAEEPRAARTEEVRAARTEEVRAARIEEVRTVGSATVDVPRGPRLEPPWRPTLPAERESAAGPERTRGLFDSLWPVDRERKGGEPRKSEPAEPRERRAEDKPAATDLGVAAVGEALAKEVGPQPDPLLPEHPVSRLDQEPPHPAPAETGVAEPAVEPVKAAEPPRGGAEPTPAGPEPAPAEDRRPVTILKSGVVDGMAYTLYSDGSIEAELPEGTIRFTSIEDLRRHLDTHS